MSLSGGIVGLPNVGKSTLFNALTAGRAQVRNYPFCTIDPNHGVVAVPDERLEAIGSFSPAEKVVPAMLELVDIAGLVKGASRGEGLGNQFLGHIRDVDAVIHVVRCFDDPDVAHSEPGIDPVRDAQVVETELLLKDLETVERALERVSKAAGTGDKEARAAEPALRRAVEALSEGTPLVSLERDILDNSAVKQLCPVTARPVLYVANVGEDDIAADTGPAAALGRYAAERGAGVVKLCAKMEAEIVRLPPQDRGAFLESMGLRCSGLETLARRVYELLNLQTFFTTNEKETRAWPCLKGIKAPRAAGLIHSDFERGFIKAEVYRLEDLEAYGSLAGLRAAGKIRVEGSEYEVGDGDIILFRFNV